MDAGISTGGVTDCLLQYGAAKVYGVDVGYGQVRGTFLDVSLPPTTWETDRQRGSFIGCWSHLLSPLFFWRLKIDDFDPVQVHERVRTDPRVVIRERVNLRLLQDLPERVNLVTLDLSFISILTVRVRVRVRVC